MNELPEILHIVVAAGSGSRFGSDLPKQFCRLGDRPVVMHAIETLRAHGRGRVVLVISQTMQDTWYTLCAEYNFESPELTYGGATRWQSVRNAVEHFGSTADIITIHDGARPLLSGQLIRRLTDAVQSGCKAVVPAIPVTDSLRVTSKDGSNHAIDRSSTVAVQTPQAFDGALLRHAYLQPESASFTDDASVVESIGGKIDIVDGETSNIKITRPLDIAVAELFIKTSF